MACRLYQKGDTHTVRGVKCTMAKFEAHEVGVQLENGWFTTPGGAYEVEVVEDEKEFVNDELTGFSNVITIISDSMSVVSDPLVTPDGLKIELDKLQSIILEESYFNDADEHTSFRNDLNEMIENLSMAITEMEKVETDGSKEEETTKEAETKETASEEEDAKILTDETPESCEDCAEDKNRITELKEKGVKDLTNKETRELADLVGIKDSQTARIATLKEEMVNA